MRMRRRPEPREVTMDGETYRHLLDRIAKLDSPRELAALRAWVLESYGESQRRRAVLECIEERLRELGEASG